MLRGVLAAIGAHLLLAPREDRVLAVVSALAAGRQFGFREVRYQVHGNDPAVDPGFAAGLNEDALAVLVEVAAGTPAVDDAAVESASLGEFGCGAGVPEPVLAVFVGVH